MKKNNLRDDFTLKQKRIIGISLFVVFLAFCGFTTWFVGRPMIKFVDEPEKFRTWVTSKGILGEILFVLMVALQVVVALIPGEPLEVGAGYAFGFLKGTILTVIGITVGSFIIFLLVRLLGIKLLRLFFKPEKINELKFLNTDKKRNLLIFILFFLPGTPKDLITYFVGLTDIKPWQYLVFVSLARLPSVVTSTLAGDALGISQYKNAVVFFIVAAVVAIVGILIYKYITKLKQKD